MKLCDFLLLLLISVNTVNSVNIVLFQRRKNGLFYGHDDEKIVQVCIFVKEFSLARKHLFFYNISNAETLWVR